ncbi:hypothetical protein DNTS_031260 [Danionella cerebrum]|uniref:Uncharacterized protein n=1 Tax=Danionella cerebrum TaxID=2873325 RepID=A0A553MNI1_9TELE|nr:hypothetical protein DNTS_031260 [Danionella translucida]
MEEVIYISSESEEEEVMRGYKEDKDDATLFVQSEWLPPELIDLTDQSFASLKQIYPRRDDCSVLEVTDLRKSNTGNANFKDEDEEGCLVAEPICRQHLSLVSCVMEEDYPEGIVQLLSDFIQPRHFPPVNITTHLLRAIFLDPTSTPFLAMEAFNLLMKTQRYHPVDKSNVPWDWELIKSVMKEQDEGSVSLRIDIRSMFLQYVLQCLEDDFKVNSQSLQQSLTKKMLSCGHQTFGQVREVITWMVNAAKESLNQEDSNKKDKHLKVVLSLQRMLSLALEVDKNPCFNSDKLAEALFVTLTRICSCRKKRLLVLNTVDSKLLKCKLLKLLLDETCFQKTHLPLSTDLIIHYLRSSMLPSDPCVKLTTIIILE